MELAFEQVVEHLNFEDYNKVKKKKKTLKIEIKFTL